MPLRTGVGSIWYLKLVYTKRQAVFLSAQGVHRNSLLLTRGTSCARHSISAGIRLPTEDEIEAIYGQLEKAKLELAECREGCKHKAQLIKDLEARKVKGTRHKNAVPLGAGAWFHPRVRLPVCLQRLSLELEHTRP